MNSIFPFFSRPIPVVGKDIVLATGLLVISMFICGLATGAAGSYALSDRRAEGQYYRALYDNCRAQTGLEALCLRSMASFRQEYDWYHLESPGWVWPLPELEKNNELQQ